MAGSSAESRLSPASEQKIKLLLEESSISN